MKNTYYLLVALCLFLTSCSTEDDNSEAEDNSIIGQWFVTAEIYNGEKETFTECSAEQYFQFTSEKELYMKLVSTNYNEICELENYTGRYELNGKNLLLKDIDNADDPIYNFEIINLSNYNLTMESTYSDSTVEITYRVELEKR